MNLSPKANLITESLTIKLSSQAKKLSDQGKKIINLTAGELDFDTPIYVQKEIKKHLHQNKYTPTIGLPKLRHAIAGQIFKDYKIKYSASNIAVTAGCKQALFESLFAILKKGDEVIVPSPDWVTYRHQIVLNDALPVIVPLTKKFDLDVVKIKKAITKKTKAIILNSPNNPTGSIYSKESLAFLKKILKNKPIYLIIDDIYSKIIYDKTYRSPTLFAPERKYLILINGFSKSQALMGWRIGYVAASKSIIQAIAAFQSHTTGNSALLSQIAAEKIIEKGDKTENFVKILKTRRDLVNNLLKTIPKISYQIPQGAFYYFIDISKIETNTTTFCAKLLNQGLALVPGEAFGAPEFVRLSYAAATPQLVAGIKILKNFCRNY